MVNTSKLTFRDLPVDMVARISGFLDEASFGRFRQTCKGAAEVTPVVRALQFRDLPIDWSTLAEAVRVAACRDFIDVLTILRDRFGFAALAPATRLLDPAVAAGRGRKALVVFIADSVGLPQPRAVEAARAAAAWPHFDVLEEICARAGAGILRECWHGACRHDTRRWPEMVAFLSGHGFGADDWAGAAGAARHDAVEIAAKTDAAALITALVAQRALTASPAALGAGLNTAAAAGHSKTAAALAALIAPTNRHEIVAAVAAAAIVGHVDVLGVLAGIAAAAGIAAVAFGEIEPVFCSAVVLPGPAVLRFFAAREPAAALCGAGYWLLRLAASSRAHEILAILWPAVVADAAAQLRLMLDFQARAGPYRGGRAGYVSMPILARTLFPRTRITNSPLQRVNTPREYTA